MDLTWCRSFVYRIISGLLILCLSLLLISAQNCPTELNDEIQRCMVPVAQFAEALGVDVKDSNFGSDHLMPSMGSEVFRQLCGKISTFSICVRKARRQCPDHITLTLINASYGYLCSEGFDVFLKNADCLMMLEHENSVRFCHERTMAVIKNSTTDGKSTLPQKLVRMCDSLNYFATCVEQPVLKECGAAAWSVIARVLHDTTKTLMPSCKFAVSIADQSISTDSIQRERTWQQVNSSKATGRQKSSPIGTMAADPAVGGKRAGAKVDRDQRRSSMNSDQTSGTLRTSTPFYFLAFALLNLCFR